MVHRGPSGLALRARWQLSYHQGRSLLEPPPSSAAAAGQNFEDPLVCLVFVGLRPWSVHALAPALWSYWPADFRGPLSSMGLPSNLPGKLHEDRAESFKAREGGRGAI